MNGKRNTFSAEMTRGRDSTFDIAKGIGMVAVIVAHIINSGIVNIALYTFHLPLFFIISGYFFNCERDFRCFARKKIRGYLIPYITCAAIISIYCAVSDALLFGKEWQMVLREVAGNFLLQKRYTTLWFLATLLVGLFIFRGIHYLCKEDRKKIGFVCGGIGVVFVLYDTLIGRPLI